eukprot:1004490-Prymnesium_polylepis.1
MHGQLVQQADAHAWPVLLVANLAWATGGATPATVGQYELSARRSLEILEPLHKLGERPLPLDVRLPPQPTVDHTLVVPQHDRLGCQASDRPGLHVGGTWPLGAQGDAIGVNARA